MSRTHSDFGSEGDREEDSVVAETTKADDTDLGTFADVVPEQRAGGSDTGAQPVSRGKVKADSSRVKGTATHIDAASSLLRFSGRLKTNFS